jgi:endoglucanase
VAQPLNHVSKARAAFWAFFYTSKILQCILRFDLTLLISNLGKFKNRKMTVSFIPAKAVALFPYSFILLPWLLFLPEPAVSQGYLHAEGKKIVNEKGENVLLRGIGLGGWMVQEGYMLKKNEEGQQHKVRARIEALIGAEKTEAFHQTWLSNHTRKIDIDSMKVWGFNSVRLPMHYNLFTLPIELEPVPGKNTWLEKGFALTDSLLSWCKRNQMYLILDLHAAPGGQGTDMNISDRDPLRPSLWESEANQQKTIALWQKLAEHYVNEEWIGGYDIINEPNWGFEDYTNDRNGIHEKKNLPLKKLMVDITNAIRSVDKKHMIIIEGNGWGNNYNGMFPPWDDNMVLSYHKYWNYNDENSVQHILKSREQYNIPVWVGETGENSNVWFTQCIALLEKNNIGWAWWPLKKLGSNNPLEVISNPGYENILAYWYGKRGRPDAASSWKAFQQLGEDLKLENNIFHKDVIDAMMRQPHSDEVRPFGAHIIGKHTTLLAADYDLGRNGKAYFDNDTANFWVSQGPEGGNKGRVYRNDGVDIAMDSASGNYYVSHFEKGEWMQYTIEISKKGKYTLKIHGMSTVENSLALYLDGELLSGNVTMKESGAGKWNVAELKKVTLSKGEHRLNLKANAGESKITLLEFTRE